MADSATIPEGEHPLLAGRYRVVRRLGAGGMGEVFLVEDLKLDGRRFAVKMLPSFLSGNRRAMASLKREALHAMELSHPHIVTVRGFEETDAGQPFLVMDYIEGQTLEDRLVDEERLSGLEIERVFSPIAESLDYAHSKGVIHRDVKPSNIMIRADGTPVIMDFGVAREAKETSTLVTGAETASGTLPYMSPEQLRGSRPERSQDIYSLAATMWECCFGEPPFCRGDIRHQILNEEPEPDPGVPVDADVLARLMAGLAKVGAERPGACAGLLGATPSNDEIRKSHSTGSESSSTASPAAASDSSGLLDLEIQTREAIGDVETLQGAVPRAARGFEALRARCGHLLEIAADYKRSRLWSEASKPLIRILEECQAITGHRDEWIDAARRLDELEAESEEVLGRAKRLGAEADLIDWADARGEAMSAAREGLQASMASLERESLVDGLAAFQVAHDQLAAETEWREQVHRRAGRRLAALDRASRLLTGGDSSPAWASELQGSLSPWLQAFPGLLEQPDSAELDRLVEELDRIDHAYDLAKERKVQSGKIDLLVKEARELAAAIEVQMGLPSFTRLSVDLEVPDSDSDLAKIEKDAVALRLDEAGASAEELVHRLKACLVRTLGRQHHRRVAAGATHTLALSPEGRVLAFGNNTSRQCEPPETLAALPSGAGGEAVISVAAGADRSFALTSEGRVFGWGGSSEVAVDFNPIVDAPKAVCLVSGPQHWLAILANGAVMAWGEDHSGCCLVPSDFDGSAGEAVAIACGPDFSVALRSDGRIRCWGGNAYGQCAIPPEISRVASSFMSIACGVGHVVALAVDGRVFAWGDDRFGQVSGPANLEPAEGRQVVDVAATYFQTVLLWSDGSVEVFGARAAFDSARNVGHALGDKPLARGMAQIAAGRNHLVVQLDETSVVALGDNYFGQCDVPPGFRGNRLESSGHADSPG